ncbi:MAG: hypothetical protein ACFFCP_04580 [Promethearchaeota archaeon]
MTEDILLSELNSIISLLDDARAKLVVDYERFQVALTNTLRLLDDASSTIDRMRGNKSSLKGYLLKTSIDLQNSTLQTFDQVKERMEKTLTLIKNT